MDNTSLASLTAQPRPFTAGGRTYEVHPLRLEDFGALQAWCDAQHPSPFDAVRQQIGNGKWTVAQEKALLEIAVKQASTPKPKLGSPECDELLTTVQGISKVIHLTIRRGDPKFTEADALALVSTLDEVQAKQLQVAMGIEQVIGGLEEGSEPDPKGVTGTGSSTPP